MRRAILLAGGLLTCMILVGCGDNTPPPAPDGVASGKGPLTSTMPPGASDAMQKSLGTKPKAAGGAHPGEVPH
jgi:hypothetical protein